MPRLTLIFVFSMEPRPFGSMHVCTLLHGMMTLPSAMSAMSFFGSKCSFSATFAISGVKMPLRAASICVVYSIFCSFPNACFGTKEKGM